MEGCRQQRSAPAVIAMPLTVGLDRDRDLGAHGRLSEAVNPGKRQRMIFGVPLSELAWLALAILVGGVVTGLLAGLFGIGGGSVIVPVLYEVFRILDVPDTVRMQLCIGTSRMRNTS